MRTMSLHRNISEAEWINDPLSAQKLRPFPDDWLIVYQHKPLKDFWILEYSYKHQKRVLQEQK